MPPCVSAAMTSFILLTCVLLFLVNGKDFVTDKEKSKVLFSKIIIICYSFSVFECALCHVI